MTLIHSLLRRLTSQQSAAAGRTLVPLQPEQLKSVAGGNTNLPRSGY